MKKLSLVFILAIILFGAEQDEVPLLKWAGPPGSKPGTYEEWIAQNPYTDFSHILDKVIHGDAREGTVAIFTEQSIANSLTNEIDQLTDNLQSEGYTVLSYQLSGGTPESLRTLLQDLYNTNNIEGALFIGNLPVAWFEIARDFGGGYTQFPCDLFYMDLDGIWLDTMNTGNGKYDGHTGNLVPEIYISRLWPQSLGNEIQLLQNYFSKNNAYRHDTLLLTQRALVFVDDDWIPWGPPWAYAVSLLYSDTMNYWDAETTRASIYRTKLDTVEAWVSLFAHSSPNLHQFTFSGGHDYYYSNEYTSQDPPANFYNFFCCSFSRYTEDCGGNRAVFNQTSGIGSVGSTKTGSMLDFNYFYQPLGDGATLGTAFKDWFTYITENGVTFDELCWHYGMTLLADCYLKPVGHNFAILETKSNTVNDLNLTLLGNPVSTSIKLKFALDESNDVKISLYDCAGREIVMLMDSRIDAGNHTFEWPIIDKYGNNLPQGVYILKTKINKDIITEKFVKI